MIIHCVKSKLNDDINVHLIIMAPTSGQYWLLIIITYGRWSVYACFIRRNIAKFD